MQTRRSSNSPPLSATSVVAATNDRSVWVIEDEVALVQFLRTRASEAGDGANFKPNVWNAAAEEMAKYNGKGAVKTAAACKSKWDRVRR